MITLIKNIITYWFVRVLAISIIFFFSPFSINTVSGNNTTEVHYINSPDGLVALFVKDNNNPSGKMYYPFTDHLGSILTVTDEQGNIEAEQSFDAWGRNRNPSDWTYNNIPSLPAWLYRGFTMHEHLPQFALINMNGRIYDPVVGRMLSPDNNLQAPDYSQSHNRYSYAFNNPLKFTDPSGNTHISDWFDTEFNTTSEFDREHFRYLGSVGGHVIPSGDFISNQTMVYEAHKKWIQNLQSSDPYGITYDAILTAGIWSDPQTGWINRMEDVTITGFVSEEGIYGYLKEQGRQKALEYYNTGKFLASGPQGGALESAGIFDPIDLITGAIAGKIFLGAAAVGTAAKGGTNLVYQGLDAAGAVRYVGITERAAAVRFGEHLSSGTAKSLLQYEVIPGATNLSRTGAKVWEQTLINQYGLGKNGGQLLNKINSIAPTNWWQYGIK